MKSVVRIAVTDSPDITSAVCRGHNIKQEIKQLMWIPVTCCVTVSVTCCLAVNGGGATIRFLNGSKIPSSCRTVQPIIISMTPFGEVRSLHRA